MTFAKSRAMMRSAFCAVLLLGLCLVAGPLSAQDLPVPEGWAALEAGNGSKAASVFREALENDPANPFLQYGAGMAAHLLGRENDAISALKKAVTSEPRFVEAHLWLGQIAYAQGDLDLAVRSFESALKLRPGNRQIASQLDAWRRESGVHSELTDRVGVRFRILFDGERQQALGTRVEGILESGYWRIGKLLDSYPAETITVVLYTNRQFTDITRAPAWAGGAYDGRIRLPAGGALRTPAELDRVVTHELVHAVVSNAARGGHVPAWVNEGLATHLESSNRSWANAVIANARVIIPLEALEQPFGGLDSQVANLAYAESAVAARLLVERLGPNLGLFLQMVGSATPVDEALSTLKVDAASFHRDWKRRLGVQ